MTKHEGRRNDEIRMASFPGSARALACCGWRLANDSLWLKNRRDSTRRRIWHARGACAPQTSIATSERVAALSLIRGVNELRINCGVMEDDKDNVEFGAVEDHNGILTIRGGGPRRDWNGIHYKQGMSAKNVGTTKLSANIATIPPGGVATAHIHVGFELILYIIEGKVRHEFGPGLKQVLEN